MSSTKTVTKTIRIKNETAEYFKDKPLNRYVDGLCAYMINGEIEGTDDGISVHTKNQRAEEGVHTNKQRKDDSQIPADVMKDIETMCGFTHIGVGDFMRELCEAMNNGDVMYEDGRFYSVNT